MLFHLVLYFLISSYILIKFSKIIENKNKLVFYLKITIILLK